MIERSLILVKHDGVVKGLIGEIIRRFERASLKLVGMKMILPDEGLANNHYVVTDEWAASVAAKTRKSFAAKGIEMKETDKEIATRIQQWNIGFLREGPVVALVLEGPHAVELGRKIVGPTEPKTAPPGTIRGDYSIESYALSDAKQRPVRNIVHASGTVEEAQREIGLWFDDNELYHYEGPHDKHIN